MRDGRKKNSLSSLVGLENAKASTPSNDEQVSVQHSHVSQDIYSIPPVEGLHFMPLFCFASDFHLNCRQYKLDERIKDIYMTTLSVIGNIALALLRCDPRVLIFGGDLFDKKYIGAQTLLNASGLFNLDFDTYFIRGNHDGSSFKAREGDVFLEALNELNDTIHYIEEGSRTITIHDHEIEFVFLSHHGSRTWRRLNDLLTSLQPKTATYRILVLHALIEGMIPNQHDVSVSDLRRACSTHGIDLVLDGHYHQRWELENPCVLCAGSPEVLDISTCDHERGFYIIGVDDHGKLASEFMPIPVAREFRDVKIDVGETTMQDAMTKTKRTLRDHDAEGIIMRFTIMGKILDGKRSSFPASKIAKSLKKPLLVMRKNALTDSFQDHGDDDDERESIDERVEMETVITKMFPNATSDAITKFSSLCWDVKNEVELGENDVDSNLMTLFKEMK